MVTVVLKLGCLPAGFEGEREIPTPPPGVSCEAQRLCSEGACVCSCVQAGGLLLLSHSVMYISLRPHGLQHTRLPCPSLSQSLLKFTSIELVMPSNHLILCLPFSSCLQSFPESWSFPISQLFPSGGQSIGVSASMLVLPKNGQD